MKDIIMTKPAFERLLEHLIYMEERMDDIIDLHCPGEAGEREELREFFSFYIKKIEGIMEKIRAVPHIYKKDSGYSVDEMNRFPFVIIGSSVTLEDVLSGKTYNCRIVHPFEHSDSISDVSYLSETGKALILKDVGSEVFFRTPGGLQCNRIISIRLS